MSHLLPNSGSGTFQPLKHRSGTLRDRLHGYTKQTLGAGGSINDAVSETAAVDDVFHGRRYKRLQCKENCAVVPRCYRFVISLASLPLNHVPSTFLIQILPTLST